MSYISGLTWLQSSKIPPNTAKRVAVSTWFKLRTEGMEGVQETKLSEGSCQWRGAWKVIVSPHLFKSLKEMEEFKARKKKKKHNREATNDEVQFCCQIHTQDSYRFQCSVWREMKVLMLIIACLLLLPLISLLKQNWDWTKPFFSGTMAGLQRELSIVRQLSTNSEGASISSLSCFLNYADNPAKAETVVPGV